MAFFKFRKGNDATPAPTAKPESVEALRRRARHRLIGAAVLVLVGVIGFPLLFDTQPRPIAVDIPIEIPDRAKVKPLPAPPPSHIPAAAPQDAAKMAGAPASASSQAAANKPAPGRDAAGPVGEAGKAATASQGKAETVAKPAPDPVKPVPEAVKPAKAAEAGRPQALAEDKPGKAHEAAGRFVVQIGAFGDVGKAREARQRVEKAGLKTYTHVAETRDGRRIRVRVGPFASRADADKAASRIKELDLPASILTL